METLLLNSSLFISSSMKESKKFICSRNFPALVKCTTSKFVTKETLHLLPQTPWHLLKPPINLIRTHYSVARCDYLIIRLVLVYQ